MAPDSIDIRQLPRGFGTRISSLTTVGNDKSGVAQVKWRSKTAFGSTKTQSLVPCLHQSMDAERLLRDPAMPGERVTMITGSVSRLPCRVSNSSRPVLADT